MKILIVLVLVLLASCGSEPDIATKRYLIETEHNGRIVRKQSLYHNNIFAGTEMSWTKKDARGRTLGVITETYDKNGNYCTRNFDPK